MEGAGACAGGAGRSFTCRFAAGSGGAGAEGAGPQLMPPPRCTGGPASGAAAGGRGAAFGRGAMRAVEPVDLDTAVPWSSVRQVDAVLPPSAERQLALRRTRPSRRGASRTGVGAPTLPAWLRGWESGRKPMDAASESDASLGPAEGGRGAKRAKAPGVSWKEPRERALRERTLERTLEGRADSSAGCS